MDAVDVSPASESGRGRWGAVAQVLDVEGAVAGAGFLVGAGVLVTCAHVVVGARSGPGGLVRLRFPHLGGAPQMVGQILEEPWRAPDAEDIAVVRLEIVPP